MRCILRPGIALGMLVAMGGGGACAIDALTLVDRACPCIAGYVCDTASNVCVLAGGGPSPDGGTPDVGAQDDVRRDVATARDGRADGSKDAPGEASFDAPDDVQPETSCSANVQTDPANCGQCKHDCLGGSCSGGVCAPVTLATAIGSIGLAIDATYVYWTDDDLAVPANSSINKISKALTKEGTPTPILSGAAYSTVQAITTDGTYVYWTNKGASGTVERALPTGANLTTIASNQGNPDWVVSNGTTVFWTNESANQVMSAPVVSDGGVTPTQLNTSGENGTVPAGIAIDAMNVYYATKTAGGGLAEFVPLKGGAVTELGSATFVGIAVDDKNVYWTGGFASPAVYQNAKTGTPSTQIAIASGGALTCPLHIVSDGTNVYFLDQGTDAGGNIVPGTGALYRVAIGNTGPLPAPLVSGLTDPQGMAVDDLAVYWVNGTTGVPADAGITTGSVMKVAK